MSTLSTRVALIDTPLIACSTATAVVDSFSSPHCVGWRSSAGSTVADAVAVVDGVERAPATSEVTVPLPWRLSPVFCAAGVVLAWAIDAARARS